MATIQEIIDYTNSWRSNNGIPEGTQLSSEQLLKFATDLQTELSDLPVQSPDAPGANIIGYSGKIGDYPVGRSTLKPVDFSNNVQKKETKMAFVNEVLSEKDKERFMSYKIKSKITSFDKLVPVPTKWTIDKDRDAILIRLEGAGSHRTGREIPLFMVLIWKDQLIRFEAFEEGRGNVETGYEVWWEVTKVVIPKALESETDSIMQLFREALIAHGAWFNPGIVHITKIASPIYVQEVQ